MLMGSKPVANKDIWNGHQFYLWNWWPFLCYFFYHA